MDFKFLTDFNTLYSNFTQMIITKEMHWNLVKEQPHKTSQFTTSVLPNTDIT